MTEGIDLDAMLAPVADVVGADVRHGGSPASGLYLAIKDARVEARLAERDALASGDPDVNPLAVGLQPWGTVVANATRLLAEDAKDLQVAAWLTEAWLRTEAWPGVAAGLSLLAGLVERFWDEGLHPQEDEDGVETRLAPLFGLFGQSDAGTLLQPLKLLPLSDHAGTDVALWTVEAVQAQSTRHEDPEIAEELAERRRARIDALEAAIRHASLPFAEEAAAAIEEALEALDRLMTAVDARAPFGRFGSQVARPLEDAAALLRVHGPGAGLEAVAALPVEEPVAANEDESDAAPATVPQRHDPVSTAMTRERALATLLEVAAFFDRNEPQSLVGQSLRDVVRRANLSLDELLAELLPDAEQRALYLLRAGISAPTETSSY